MTNLELILLTRTLVDIVAAAERIARHTQQERDVSRAATHWRDYVRDRRIHPSVGRYRQR